MQIIRNIFLLFILFVAGCDNQDANNGIKPLTVMISPDNPPFEFVDTASGSPTPVGFDVDLINIISEEIGRPVKIVEVDFNAILPALQSGRADMAISTIVPTDERRKNVEFSEPYFEYRFAAVIPNASNVKSHEDFANKRVGVQLGSSHEEIAYSLATSDNDLKIISLNKVGELIQELKNNRVDLVLTEEVTAKNIVKNNPGLKVVSLRDLKGESPSIAFPKNSPWREEISAAILRLEASGKLKELVDKWFSHDLKR